MLTHQLSSKNLTVNERMAMVDDFKEEVRLENEKKKKETEGRPSKNCTPIGVQNTDSTETRSRGETWTDAQVARKAGVGVGTVARYNKVMNSNEEDLKKKVLANDKVSAQRIKEENEKKKLVGNKLGADITNGKTVSVQMDGERKSHTSPTHTREQVAKMSGVGAGTVARYDRKMQSYFVN